MAGQWNVSCLSAGLPGGMQINETVTVVAANVVGEVLFVNFSAGDNTFTIPTGAISVQIIPPSTNAQALKFRTSLNAADGGLPISATDQFGPHIWRGLSPTTVIVNAAGTVTGVQITFL